MESMDLLQGFIFQENRENMIFGQPFDSILSRTFKYYVTLGKTFIWEDSKRHQLYNLTSLWPTCIKRT